MTVRVIIIMGVIINIIKIILFKHTIIIILINDINTHTSKYYT